MDLSRVPPSVLLQWADEVRYLHSLWHQAGPPLNPNPNPNPNPNLAPVQTTAFKKPNKRNKSKTKSPSVSEVEWPVNPTPDAGPSGWPDTTPNPHPMPKPSEAEQAKANALRVQQSALKSSKDFLDGYEGMSEDEGEEEDEEGKAFEFFIGVFTNDGELRGYYEKNHEKGEFLCLVCGGTGVKIRKRYGNCTGLMQHTNSISKTKRRGSHRGFGRAVCRVLGWDIKRLPSIVLDVEKPLGQTLANAARTQGGLQKLDGVQKIVDIRNDDLQEEDVRDIAAIPDEVGMGDEKKEFLEGSKKRIHQILGSPNPLAAEVLWSDWGERIPAQTDTQPKSIPSSEEQARATASRVHWNGLRATENFLAEPDDDEEDEDDDDEVEQRESIALKFFLGLFELNKDIRNYYEKNSLKGEFICLVCAGMRKKMWKRFGDCMGLVQHAKTISSTKKTWAHRAFAKAICQVLDWDINGNPGIVIPPKDSLNQSLATSAKVQDETNEDGNAD